MNLYSIYFLFVAFDEIQIAIHFNDKFMPLLELIFVDFVFQINRKNYIHLKIVKVIKIKKNQNHQQIMMKR